MKKLERGFLKNNNNFQLKKFQIIKDIRQNKKLNIFQEKQLK